MSVLKYTISEISAYSILSAAVETKNGYCFSFDATDPSKSYMVEETKQDDCPIFYQAMRVLGYNEKNLDASEKLRDVFVFINFSGIFDRKPIGKVLEAQKKAEYMFRPEGINIFFGKQEYRYIAFERSASMSRQSRICTIHFRFACRISRALCMRWISRVFLQNSLFRRSRIYGAIGTAFPT